MKYSIAVKFIAVALCALSLVAVVAGGFGIVVASESGLYSRTIEEWKADQMESDAYNIAYSYVRLYAAENLGGCSEPVLRALYNEGYFSYFTGKWSVVILENGKPVDGVSILESGTADLNKSTVYHYNINVRYPVEVDYAYPTEPEVAAYSITEPTEEPLYTDWIDIENEYGYLESVDLAYYEGPTYEVNVYLEPDSVSSLEYMLVQLLYQYRFHLIGAVALGILLFAVTLVYLCCAAGRKSGTTEVRPMGLNRVPLDLYAVVACVGCGLLIWAGFEMAQWIFYNGENWALLSLVALCAFGAALLAIGFVFAFSAQVKSKGGYWWRHMILGWFAGLVSKFFRWVGGGLTWARNGIRGVYNLLPVIWQWLLTAFGLVAAVGLSALLSMASYGLGELFWGLVCAVCVMGSVVVVLYGGYCFGTLLKGAQNMAHGNLNHKVPTEHMYGAFGDFAEELNNLAEGAKIAAERQMKSERMKTELITNVSHDIKTPLTSIINYVDLMKKPHSDAAHAQYLDVLDRQSQRLKKLIDDLMEMSKASTGNLTVELTQVDAVEAVNQALGEFADKLASVNLTPVFRHPDDPVYINADGRLLWRVLSNLLGNAHKYALPDTRLYIDLMVLQGNAVIAVKNISREQLNVNAEELMERFVRGDASRNTEGSGLGLNIAKSLVELQQGQMHLMVDGDLFKVTLIFPLAQ